MAIGPALVMGSEGFRIPQKLVRFDILDSEMQRFRAARGGCVEEIALHEQLASARLGKQYGAIFAAHRQLAEDPKLGGEIETTDPRKVLLARIRRQPGARGSTRRPCRTWATAISPSGPTICSTSRKRILRHLLGERREELTHLTDPVIVLAHNLTPSETANLDKQFVLGFSTEVGGKSSHTAILAGALGLPAVVGVGSFLAEVSGGETIIIDGHDGVVVIDPDEDTLQKLPGRRRAAEIGGDPAQVAGAADSRDTRDGVQIKLFGNIEFPSEVDIVSQSGAAGIGLYRTEFLYLEGGQEPTEEAAL